MTIRYFALTPVVSDKPTGLLRLTIGAKDLVLESYDARKRAWIDSPEAIVYLNGDDSDADEVNEVEANKILATLKA